MKNENNVLDFNDPERLYKILREKNIRIHIDIYRFILLDVSDINTLQKIIYKLAEDENGNIEPEGFL